MLFVRQSIQTFPDILSIFPASLLAPCWSPSYIFFVIIFTWIQVSLCSRYQVPLLSALLSCLWELFKSDSRASSLVFFQFANKRLSSFFVHYRALQLGRCRNATLNWHFASGFLEVLAAADIIFSFTLISPNSAVTTLRPPLAYLIIKCHFNNRCNTSGLP